MKLQQKSKVRRKNGMTLLELTVVIVVLLSLIAILFVGARAWKKGSDRATNILNFRNCQQAMRGHQNMYNLNAEDPFDQAELEKYMRFPSDFSGISYTAGEEVTPFAEVDDGVVSGTGHIWLSAESDGGANPYEEERNDYGIDLQDTVEW